MLCQGFIILVISSDCSPTRSFSFFSVAAGSYVTISHSDNVALGYYRISFLRLE
ncbi:MAG: hypothetical protein J6U86_06720 [Clostridia bacterium]|nr:hypothetical protein [Clostridia bacterium]